jgi:hypothetical protein
VDEHGVIRVADVHEGLAMFDDDRELVSECCSIWEKIARVARTESCWSITWKISVPKG